MKTRFPTQTNGVVSNFANQKPGVLSAECAIFFVSLSGLPLSPHGLDFEQRVICSRLEQIDPGIKQMDPDIEQIDPDIGQIDPDWSKLIQKLSKLI